MLPIGDLQVLRLRILDPVAFGERLHPVLDLADIGVETHQRETDPAGHLRDADRDGARRHNIPGVAIAPCHSQSVAPSSSTGRHPASVIRMNRKLADSLPNPATARAARPSSSRAA